MSFKFHKIDEADKDELGPYFPFYPILILLR